MKQFDFILKNEAVKVLAINLTVAIVVPVAVSLVAPFARPVARGFLKTGVRAYEKVRESASEFGELVEDVVAEVQEELSVKKGDANRLVKTEQKSK